MGLSERDKSQRSSDIIGVLSLLSTIASTMVSPFLMTAPWTMVIGGGSSAIALCVAIFASLLGWSRSIRVLGILSSVVCAIAGAWFYVRSDGSGTDELKVEFILQRIDWEPATSPARQGTAHIMEVVRLSGSKVKEQETTPVMIKGSVGVPSQDSAYALENGKLYFHTFSFTPPACIAGGTIAPEVAALVWTPPIDGSPVFGKEGAILLSSPDLEGYLQQERGVTGMPLVGGESLRVASHSSLEYDRKCNPYVSAKRVRGGEGWVLVQTVTLADPHAPATVATATGK